MVEFVMLFIKIDFLMVKANQKKIVQQRYALTYSVISLPVNIQLVPTKICSPLTFGKRIVLTKIRKYEGNQFLKNRKTLILCWV